MKIKKGMYVEVTGGLRENEIGRVVVEDYFEDSVGLYFDSWFEGHSCDNALTGSKQKSGWYVDKNYLKPTNLRKRKLNKSLTKINL